MKPPDFFFGFGCFVLGLTVCNWLWMLQQFSQVKRQYKRLLDMPPPPVPEFRAGFHFDDLVDLSVWLGEQNCTLKDLITRLKEGVYVR